MIFTLNYLSVLKIYATLRILNPVKKAIRASCEMLLEIFDKFYINKLYIDLIGIFTGQCKTIQLPFAVYRIKRWTLYSYIKISDPFS